MKVVCSFDDGTAQDLRVAELMAKYGVECTFYWPVAPLAVNEPKGRLSLDNQERAAIAGSFEIGSHTLTHPLLTRIPFNQAVFEIRQSKKMLEIEFKKPVTKFAYPRGYANDQLQAAVREAGYSGARSTLVGYVHHSENPYFEQTTVHVGCDRKEYADIPWFEYALNMLRIARSEPDSIFHMFGHSWELNAYPKGWKKFETLLKEVTA